MPLQLPIGGGTIIISPSPLNISTVAIGSLHAALWVNDNGGTPVSEVNPTDYGFGFIWSPSSSNLVLSNTLGSNITVQAIDPIDGTIFVQCYWLEYGPSAGVPEVNSPLVTVHVSDGGGGSGDVSGIIITPHTKTIGINESFHISAEITPETAINKSIFWSTSNMEIATVDPSGNVVGISSGTATITATTADGGHTDICSVTVNPNYTVTFDTRGGEPVPDQIVESGSQCHKPVTAQYHGYKLLGWYTDTLYTSPFDFDTPITANITLYAKWKDLKVYTSCGKWIVSKITYEQGAEKLTLHCVSLASKLDKQYYRGIHGTQNVTAIIADIFDAAKVSSSNIDSASITDRFGSATSSIPLPVCTCREALAYICSAFGCHLEITRSFKFTFKRNRIGTPTQKLTTLGTPYSTGTDLYTDDPSADNEDIVRVGTGLSYNYKVASSATNIEDGTTMTFESAAVGEYQDFVLEHDAISTSGFSLTASGADISNINSYAYATRFRATRTNSSSFDFTITLTGKLINITSKQKASVERTVSEYTEDNNGVLAYDNPVYQSGAILKRTLNEVVDTTNKPVITISTRDDPKLLLGESIELEGNFATNEAGLYTVIGAKRSIDGSNPTTYDLI